MFLTIQEDADLDTTPSLPTLVFPDVLSILADIHAQFQTNLYAHTGPPKYPSSPLKDPATSSTSFCRRLRRWPALRCPHCVDSRPRRVRRSPSSSFCIPPALMVVLVYFLMNFLSAKMQAREDRASGAYTDRSCGFAGSVDLFEPVWSSTDAEKEKLKAETFGLYSQVIACQVNRRRSIPPLPFPLPAWTPNSLRGRSHVSVTPLPVYIASTKSPHLFFCQRDWLKIPKSVCDHSGGGRWGTSIAHQRSIFPRGPRQRDVNRARAAGVDVGAVGCPPCAGGGAVAGT
ncbi:hypothetical protein OF83DRAFT_119710 [Amylostereum chailletii]|nr:hypothetical protein OF83DRAFT_119710 [Amylostereum chailletii]